MLIDKEEMIDKAVRLIDISHRLRITGNSLFGERYVWRVRVGYAIPYARAMSIKEALYIDYQYPPLSSFARGGHDYRYNNSKELMALLRLCADALSKSRG